MPTQSIETFEMCGRRFTVLWKPSATYLRSDGRMWGGSLGEDLTQPEAIEQAKLRAAMMLIKEREQEEILVHRLFESPMAEEVLVLASDYVLFSACLPMKVGSSVPVEADAVYAPFNQNTYLCTMKGWRYVGSFASQDEAAAALAPWCQTQQVKPCRDAQRKFLADLAYSGAGGGSNPMLTRSQRFFASVRTEFYVLFFFVTLLGLCWAWYKAVNAWPWVLPVLCALVFLGSCVALWVQRKGAVRKNSEPE